MVLSENSSLRERLRVLGRSLRIFLHVVLGLVLAIFSGLLFFPDRRYHQGLVRWWHGAFCRILQVRIHCDGVQGQDREPALWICNHVSWLDIPILGALFPVRFVAKAEIAHWPLIGHLARAAGTIFIKRGSGDAASVSDRLVDHLRQGRSCLFFPEGTTTDGQAVKRFYHKLFVAAAPAQRPLQPVLLCYRLGDGLHPLVPFIGDDTFFPHVLALMRGAHIDVHVRVLPTVAVQGRDPRTLARDMEVMMAQQLRCLIADEALGLSTVAVTAEAEALLPSRTEGV